MDIGLRGLAFVVASFVSVICLTSGYGMAAANNETAVGPERHKLDALYCNAFTVFVDVKGYPYAKNALLRGRKFTIWMEYPAGRYSGSSQNAPLGYRLDNGPIAGVLAKPGLVALSFANLVQGSHELRIGFLKPDQRFDLDQRYCFTVPGYANWSGYEILLRGI